MIKILQRSGGIIVDLNTAQYLSTIVILTAGTVFLMWIGELITEKKIGNGISLIIFAGIVSGIPRAVPRMITDISTNPNKAPGYIAFLVIAVLTVAGVVIITEGQRNIPISYAKRVRGNRMYGGFDTHLPLKVNQAGMIPIIFAVSLVTFPSIIGQFLLYGDTGWVQSIGRFATTQFTPNNWLYILVYFLLVIAFTFFYVSITFNTEQVAENIQKRGGFIPGLRPGKETAEYLSKVSNRMNVWGGLLIGGIAILPLVIHIIFTETGVGSVPMIVSGAGIIIIVGVVLDLVRRINSELLVHHYDRFYKG